jgi:hypothetical protein
MAKLVTPFINGFVWEIKQFPRCGVHYNYHPINDIFFYNSLEDRTFSHENKVACVQVPEEQIININLGIYDIPQISEKPITVKDFVHKHKDTIIEKQYPIIRKQILNNKESWICDLNMIFYDLNRQWK